MDQRVDDPVSRRREAPALSMLPARDGLAMPAQVLWPERGRPDRRAVRFARLAMLALVVAGTTAFAVVLYQVLSVQSPTVLQLVFLVASTLCFAWIMIGSASALLGFVTLMLQPEPVARPLLMRGRGLVRTALLFPVYREEPEAVAAAIDAMVDDLVEAAATTRFDIFILSDTQDASERLTELSIYAELRRRRAGSIEVFIRWRTPNTAKKAGNIASWIEGYGAAYRYFVILDADSVMAASTLLELVEEMEEDPRTGLIQTVPRLIGGVTTFARLQQFAANVYGPVLAAGLAAWHGRNGNYWGHNAIVRTEAFARTAGLPHLAGAPPLGGHILSHDFVEAALLRRAGWYVRLMPRLGGSWEGCPPALGDLIVRDRRWAQGNLQHMRLLSGRGLTLVSRLHLLLGAVSYISAPVWALTLLIGMLLALQGKYTTPSYFGSESSLFPKWPVFDAKKALALFVVTVIVVHLPKLLGAIWALRDARERARHGGAARVISGTVLESVCATLVAPVLMVTQTSAVLAILAGRDAGWGAQRRAGGDAPFAEILRQHRWHLAWGLLTLAACITISNAVLAWMSPIILGLVCAAPFAKATAHAAPRWVASVLATREEHAPDPLLQRLAAKRAEWRDVAHGMRL
jgi:membrane glycosyltransferase